MKPLPLPAPGVARRCKQTVFDEEEIENAAATRNQVIFRSQEKLRPLAKSFSS
jgi:hypothetical protein